MSRGSRCAERLGSALVASALAGCVIHSGTIVLLPERNGRDAAVTVRQGDDSVVLDRPYAAASVTVLGPRTYAADADDVRTTFADALAAQPLRPLIFTLHFTEQSDELTEESRRMLAGIVEQISRYPAPDIAVIGHTDLVGSDAFNDALSRKRAESVRAALAARGIATDSIVAVGRGKREPAVPTPEGVAEPRNRRAEIIVR